MILNPNLTPEKRAERNDEVPRRTIQGITMRRSAYITKDCNRVESERTVGLLNKPGQEHASVREEPHGGLQHPTSDFTPEKKAWPVPNGSNRSSGSSSQARLAVMTSQDSPEFPQRALLQDWAPHLKERPLDMGEKGRGLPDPLKA